MCEVTIYVSDKIREDKLIEKVSGYEIDIQKRSLVAYSISEKREFKFDYIDRIKWLEFNNSLIIEGKLEKIVQK